MGSVKRIRVEFPEEQFRLDEPLCQRTWLLVPSTLKNVNGLSWLICDKFSLKNQWKEGKCTTNAPPLIISDAFHCFYFNLFKISGISLLLDGFVLPPTEHIDIIRDNDSIV